MPIDDSFLNLTGGLERIMNHAEVVQEAEERALEAEQRWEHLAEARTRTTNAMRTGLEAY